MYGRRNNSKHYPPGKEPPQTHDSRRESPSIPPPLSGQVAREQLQHNPHRRGSALSLARSLARSLTVSHRASIRVTSSAPPSPPPPPEPRLRLSALCSSPTPFPLLFSHLHSLLNPLLACSLKFALRYPVSPVDSGPLSLSLSPGPLCPLCHFLLCLRHPFSRLLHFVSGFSWRCRAQSDCRVRVGGLGLLLVGARRLSQLWWGLVLSSGGLKRVRYR